ncbi:MAG: prepilin-type N-terminal cleavage/methylation domain-containing protein [Candidatus Omnitrophota bacterium]
MISRTGRFKRDKTALRGFTLVELIVVMTMLAVVMALAAPSLSRFSYGRKLEEEARRFLALTRYARSQAVSLSLPIEIWIDDQNGWYGLRPAAGFEDLETEAMKPVEFHLPSYIRIETPGNDSNEKEAAAILYWSDGSLDERSAIAFLLIEKDEGRTGKDLEQIGVVQMDYGLGYSLIDDEKELLRWAETRKLNR